MIVNLYKHRGYIWRTAWSEVRTRYAGAGLGAVWNLLQPLSMILIFTIIFTQVMTQTAPIPVPYPVYLCAALLPWSAFSECINRGTQAFVTNAVYLRKLPIPEQVFVAQTALSTAIGLALSYTVLVIISVALHHAPSWHWLLLPIPLALLIGMGFGLGMFLGTLNAFIRDVGQAVPIILQVWFWTYPIVYHVKNLPPGMQAAVRYNPIYPFMESIRDLFQLREIPGLSLWIGMVGWTLLTSAIGYLVLRRLRPELRDVI
jgi:ABC-type polysaccharide/polyol phosphate export permease